MKRERTARRTREPKILLVDIETLPNKVASWNIGRKVSLSYDNILEERHIICASWKWFGHRSVRSISSKGPYNKLSDRKIVQRLYRELAKADAVVGHNINKFDLPYIRARGLYYGLKPFPPIKQIDTYVIARKKFYFNSNRLDYLGKFLGVGKKISTNYGLWLDCMNGCKKALAKMLRYNRQDVKLLEKVYRKLQPYATNHIPVLSNAPRLTSPCCGAAIQYRGEYISKSARYARFVCTVCGNWGREQKATHRANGVSI